jgi:hypothetical protein
MYLLCVHLYRSAISAHLLLHLKYASKSMELQSMLKINSSHYELTVNKMSAYTTSSQVQQSTLFAFHPSHLFQERKIDLRFPLKNIRSTLWPLRNCSTAALVTNPTSTIPKQAYRRSILLTAFISLRETRKRLNPPKCKSQILPT